MHTCTHSDVFSQLNSALEQLRVEEFTWDEDINFLQTFLRDPQLQSLSEVNDHVAQSQSLEQPVGPSGQLCYEVWYSVLFKLLYTATNNVVMLVQAYDTSILIN